MVPFLRFLAALVSVLPNELAMMLGSGLGGFWFHVLRYRRRVAVDNILRAYGSSPGEPKARELCRRNMIHLCKNVVEFLRLAGGGARTMRPRLEYQDWDRLDGRLKNGQGAIIISGHLGNIEYLPAAIVKRGINLHILTKNAKSQPVDRIWRSARKRLGIRLLPRRDAVRPILSALRAGEAVGIMIDQHQDVGGLILDFFGRPASTTEAPAVFAERTGAPVFPIFMERSADNRHVLRVHPDLGFERISDDRATNIRHNMERYNRVLEEQVRRLPDQWIWVHRRWKV